jgi:hypothetical protein
MMGSPFAGAFKIKPYRAGPLNIQYSIVTKTSCGEEILHGPIGWSVILCMCVIPLE